MKILMVCLGNICRSPLAEGLLAEKVKYKGLNWTVDSAGTSSWHIGEPPDPRSIQVAQKNGVDISQQKARQFVKADLERFDVILAMDQSNFMDINQHATEQQKEKVHMILNFVHPKANRSVPDPYWDDDGFDQIYGMLEEATEHLIMYLESLQNKRPQL